MTVRSHLFNSGPSSVLRGRGLAPLRGVLTELLIDDGFTVTEERVLSVPVSLLELVVELMRWAGVSFLVIVQPVAKVGFKGSRPYHSAGATEGEEARQSRTLQIMSRQEHAEVAPSLLVARGGR